MKNVLKKKNIFIIKYLLVLGIGKNFMINHRLIANNSSSSIIIEMMGKQKQFLVLPIFILDIIYKISMYLLLPVLSILFFFILNIYYFICNEE